MFEIRLTLRERLLLGTALSTTLTWVMIIIHALKI